MPKNKIIFNALFKSKVWQVGQAQVLGLILTNYLAKAFRKYQNSQFV